MAKRRNVFQRMGFLKILYPTVSKEDEEPLHFKMAYVKLCRKMDNGKNIVSTFFQGLKVN